MRHALVAPDGVVVNVIELEPGAPWDPPSGHQVIPSDEADIGDTWDGRTFTEPADIPPDRDVLRREDLEQKMLERALTLTEVQEFLVLRYGIIEAEPRELGDI